MIELSSFPFRRPSAEREVFDSNKAPKLLDPLQSVRVPEKEPLTLRYGTLHSDGNEATSQFRCRFSGEPKLSIKWYKDGERVFAYGPLQLVRRGNTLQMFDTAISRRNLQMDGVS